VPTASTTSRSASQRWVAGSRIWAPSESGWRSSTTNAGSWEISDAGGYAHLIHAIALWLIYEDGKREWEIVRKNFPEEPIPAEPLPATVLKAQGLAD